MASAAAGLPSGWTFTSLTFPGGLATSIAIPGSPGIVRVLDELSCKLQTNASATPIATQINVTTTDGVYNNQPVLFIVLPGGSWSADGDSQSGLNICGGPGAGLVVTAAAMNNVALMVVGKGHDV